jgi:hypothetical protein
MGSGQVKTGWSTQSDLSPGAWFVDDPSKPQIGSSVFPCSMILVFERSLAVGAVPSTQMYSALYAIRVPFLHGGGAGVVRGHARSAQLPGLFPSVNAM